MGFWRLVRYVSESRRGKSELTDTVDGMWRVRGQDIQQLPTLCGYSLHRPVLPNRGGE